jgi:G3E family GTPase
MHSNRLPATVLSGFLGAGCTLHEGLLTEQIEFADGVVVNKIDKVDAARQTAA